MATFHSVLKFLVGHILAGAVVILGTLGVMLAGYAWGLSTTPDAMDTPVAAFAAFLGVLIMTALFAVGASAGCFLVSVLFTWMRSQKHFPVWLPVIFLPTVTFFFMLLLFWGTQDLSLVGIVTGLVFVYFGVYWTLLTFSGAVLDFIRRRLAERKTD
jgi:hypothetical protein